MRRTGWLRLNNDTIPTPDTPPTIPRSTTAFAACRRVGDVRSRMTRLPTTRAARNGPVSQLPCEPSMERRDRFASVHGRILARSVPLVLGYFPASLPGLDRPYAIVALSQ